MKTAKPSFIKFNKKSEQTKLKQKDQDISSSSSIVARAGQVMAIIIALGVLGMISSMLVSESLSGDAAQINRAGALRMQALRISRAIVITKSPQQYNADSSNKSETVQKVISLEKASSTEKSGSTKFLRSASRQIELEIDAFDQKIVHLFEGGVTSFRDVSQIEQQYQEILTEWQAIKAITVSFVPPDNNTQKFDSFVVKIDQLVTLLQKESEKKLAILRLIQGVSLFALMIIAFVVLFRLNRSVIAPLKQIVTVAARAGKGDFSLKASYQSDNELGVLARTINQMSQELELKHQDYQDRVDKQTKALTRSNQYLQVLYKATSNLASNQYQYTDSDFLNELDKALGIGKVYIKRYAVNNKPDDTLRVENLLSEFSQSELKVFPIEKTDITFGLLVWHYPKDTKVRSWHTKMLQAMSDIIATTIDLEERRRTEERVLIFEERAIIARELHDSLAQSLSYLKVQMSLLTRRIEKQSSQSEIESTIVDIKEGLNSAYRQLRELLTTFRLKLDDPSLNNALQGTVIEFTEKCQHPILLDYSLPENLLTPSQEIHILQIVREALSNVQRHAHATNAGVVLNSQSNYCVIKIWDDGVGHQQTKTLDSHFGLGIMQERAKSLGSNIEMLQREPNGTIIQLQFTV